MEVRLPYYLADAEVTGNIACPFKWHIAIPDEKINIKVTDGWGVKGISNRVTVTPGVNKLLLKIVLTGVEEKFSLQ
jgi:hypothetical protein